jgi:hypothetical protein
MSGTNNQAVTSASLAVTALGVASFTIPGVGEILGPVFLGIGSLIGAMNQPQAPDLPDAAQVQQIVTNAVNSSLADQSAQQYTAAILSVYEDWHTAWYVLEVRRKRPLSVDNLFFGQIEPSLYPSSNFCTAIEGLFNPTVGCRALSALALGTALHAILGKILIIRSIQLRKPKELPADMIEVLAAQLHNYADRYPRVADATETAAQREMMGGSFSEARKQAILQKWYHGDPSLRTLPVVRLRTMARNLEKLIQT